MNKQETIENYIINYKKHCFSKNIRITLKDEDSILVTLPYLCSYKKARDFLLANFEKIKNFQFKSKKYTPKFTTKFDTLKIIQSDCNQTVVRKNIVYFYYCGDFYAKNTQKELKNAHLKALRIESRYLADRLSYLAKKYGFSYQKLSLRNQKTRFGSCSYQNNINLNINLMNYDFDVIDYVIIHELVHTKVKNHSKDFWLEVEKYCPNYKELRKKLKNCNN